MSEAAGSAGIIDCARLRASQQVVQAGFDPGGNGFRELAGLHLDEDPRHGGSS
jgi:hypothetical protein